MAGKQLQETSTATTVYHDHHHDHDAEVVEPTLSEGPAAFTDPSSPPPRALAAAAESAVPLDDDDGGFVQEDDDVGSGAEDEVEAAISRAAQAKAVHGTDQSPAEPSAPAKLDPPMAVSRADEDSLQGLLGSPRKHCDDSIEAIAWQELLLEDEEAAAEASTRESENMAESVKRATSETRADAPGDPSCSAVSINGDTIDVIGEQDDIIQEDTRDGQMETSLGQLPSSARPTTRPTSARPTSARPTSARPTSSRPVSSRVSSAGQRSSTVMRAIVEEH